MITGIIDVGARVDPRVVEGVVELVSKLVVGNQGKAESALDQRPPYAE